MMKSVSRFGTIECALEIFGACLGYFGILWLLLPSVDHVRLFAIERFYLPVLYALGRHVGKRLQVPVNSESLSARNGRWMMRAYWLCLHTGACIWCVIEVLNILKVADE